MRIRWVKPKAIIDTGIFIDCVKAGRRLWAGEVWTVDQAIKKTVNEVLDGKRSAVYIEYNGFKVKATRRHKKVTDRLHEVILSIGKANHRERGHIRRWKKRFSGDFGLFETQEYTTGRKPKR